MDKESLIGKWAAYFLDGDCCSGFGEIVGISCIGLIEVDEYPGGTCKTGVLECDVEVFDTSQEAMERFHKDDEKRNDIRLHC
jgi:hypothetical protein